MKGVVLSLCATAALIVSLAQAGGIKKWVDADGNVHFGDVPAGGTVTEQVEVKVIRANPGNYRGMLSGSSVRLKQGESRRNLSSTSSTDSDRDYGERMRYRNAAVKGKVLVDMTPDEARRAWGPPVKINASGGKYGEREQWVYETPTGRKYLYIRNGRVTSWN